MNATEMREVIASGGRVYGTLVVSPSPHWPEALARAGLDFVFIDTEHIALDRETVSWMCRAYGSAGLAPIVRIPSPDPFAASGMLDAGAAGIIAPYVETVAQARAMRGAVKLAPLKGERLARVLAGDETPEPELADYLTARGRERLLLLNIESTPAVENLDAILAVPGVDGVIVGPHDLSCSLGEPENYTSERFSAAIQEILSKTRGRGLIAGVHFMNCGPTSLAAEWMKWGCNLLVHHADIVLAARGLAEQLNELRTTFGDTPTGEAPRTII